MQITFKKPVRGDIYLKIGMMGVSNSGKTYSALRLARGIVGSKGKIALVDTENNSAALYCQLFNFDSVAMKPPYHPHKFTAAIDAAVEQGYNILILDSISHEWAMEGGVLDIKAGLDEANPGSNQFTNWKKPGQLHSEFINKILHAPIHIISCMRSKSQYVMQENRYGKMAPVKHGLAPIQRDGLEYEFSLLFNLALNHHATVDQKDRTQIFKDVEKPFIVTEETGGLINKWLNKK